MKNKYRLPIFSDQALSEIIFGMENQEADYVLNVRDGNAYRSDMLGESFSDPESETFVPLPDWTSADGYQLMVSFSQSCTNPDLKKALTRQLSMKAKGVFRRFKATLEEFEALQSWYDYKDKKMKAYIVSWYGSRPSLFDVQDESESADDEMGDSSLLVDFDVQVCNMSDEIRTYIESGFPKDPMLMKMYASMDCDRVALLYGKEVCGVIPFATLDGISYIPYYYINENVRGLGLFHLLFDQLCRALKREKISEVVIVSREGESFLKMLNDNNVQQSFVAGIVRFKLDNWTSQTESSDMAYLV